MHRARIFTGTLTILLTAAAAEPLLARQSTGMVPYSREPLPEGKRIVAADGDLIVVEGDARVKFVRRRHAAVRLIFNAEERWALLLADFVRDGRADGYVDFQYGWRQVEGTWPLEPRWDGMAILEDYAYPGQRPGGLGIVVPAGRIQFLPGAGPIEPGAVEANALAVLRHRGGGGGSGSGTFDQAENRGVAELKANLRRDASGGLATGAIPRSGGEPVTYSTITPGPPPVRVGGSIRAPQKTHHVDAVYPEAARQAGVAGVVILEITIGADGAVTSTRVLSGQPMLDAAAIEAARQWRYEPTLLNGSPVPVIMTATVNFPR